MTALIIARHMPLDDLVARVYHLELLECRDEKEFRDAIRLMQHNLDEVSNALGCDLSTDRRICRAVDRVKIKAAHLKGLCAAVPESFSDPQGWRFTAEQIMVNYEQFRIEAGVLYRLAIPGSGFGVLRAAL
jgi:hypothetical protein